jgi:hypothetical protein
MLFLPVGQEVDAGMVNVLELVQNNVKWDVGRYLLEGGR